MSRGELPDHWAKALKARRIASIRGVATAAHISPMAASRLVKGESTSAKTVRLVADALFAGDRNRVWELHGSTLRDHGDWQLPEEASLLDDDQRAAVVSIVRAMLPPDVRGGGAGVKRAAATNQPGSGPVPTNPIALKLLRETDWDPAAALPLIAHEPDTAETAFAADEIRALLPLTPEELLAARRSAERPPQGPEVQSGD